MITREELENKSEEDLEGIYQKLKSDFDNKSSKNKRIRGMLNRKIELKEGIIKKLQQEIEEILTNNPGLNVSKQTFDDKKYDPIELREEIQEMQRSISILRTRKLKAEEGIKDLEKYIRSQKPKENQIEEEIELLIKENQDISSDSANETESNELKALTQEYQRIQDDLTDINNKINELSNRIHNYGK